MSSSSSSSSPGTAKFDWNDTSKQWVCSANNCRSGYLPPTSQQVYNDQGAGTPGKSVVVNCVTGPQ
jgi:hypothetical protein